MSDQTLIVPGGAVPPLLTRRSGTSSGRRSAVVASGSTVVVFGVLGLLLTSSPGWDTVRETFLSTANARRAFPLLLEAFWLNVKIFLVAEPLILVLALVIALMRGLRGAVFFPVRFLATAYTDIFRGAPLLVWIYLFGFGVPTLRLTGIPSDPLVWGVVALVLSYSAYVAEVYRAGIDSVHPSQRAAARSLGLTSAQTMRFVVLPQAVRRVVPPLLNDFISLQKDTALISVLGPIEVVRQAGIYQARYFNYTPMVIAALLFIAITVPLARFTDRLIARSQRRSGAGG